MFRSIRFVAFAAAVPLALGFASLTASAAIMPAIDEGSATQSVARAESSIIPGTDANYKDLIEMSKQKPVIFQLSGDHCGACKELLPKLEAKNKADGGTWIFSPVDGERAPQAKDFFTMWGYPTVIPYGHGVEMTNPKRFTGGGQNQAKVDAYVDSVVAAFKGGTPTASPTVKPTQPTISPTIKPTQPTTPTVAPTTTAPTTTPPTVEPTSHPDGKLPPLPAGAVQVTSSTQFDSDVIAESNKRVVIVDFSKDLCEPCVAISPILEKKYVTDKGAWQLARIDGTQVPDVWAKYDKPWFPTLIAIKNGKELGRFSGFDGNAQPVIEFIDKAVAGQNPGADPKVMDIKDQSAWDKAKAISFRHPVVLRVNMDRYLNANRKQNDVAVTMAEGDGGKWTLANVDSFSPMMRTLRTELGAQNLAGMPALHVIIYQGKARVEDGLTTLSQMSPNEPQLREWVNTMLSHHYKQS